MKKLKIDLSELEEAFETDESSGMEYYLDQETGEVVLITEDDRWALRSFFEEGDEDDDLGLDDELEEDEEEPESDEDSEAGECDLTAEFEAWLEDYRPDWQKDSIRRAFAVDQDAVGRFLPVPTQDSREGYNDMVAFAETVKNERLRDLLDVALDGKGAFRRFKDVLDGYPEERQRWFAFKNQQVRQRILDWLESEGIEAEDTSKHGG